MRIRILIYGVLVLVFCAITNRAQAEEDLYVGLAANITYYSSQAGSNDRATVKGWLKRSFGDSRIDLSNAVRQTDGSGSIWVCIYYDVDMLGTDQKPRNITQAKVNRKIANLDDPSMFIGIIYDNENKRGSKIIQEELDLR